MNKIKKWVAGAALIAMTTSTANTLDAQEYYTDLGGVGYEDSISVPSLTPYIAVCTLALVAIVVLAVRHHHHAHAHSSSASAQAHAHN